MEWASEGAAVACLKPCFENPLDPCGECYDGDVCAVLMKFEDTPPRRFSSVPFDVGELMYLHGSPQSVRYADFGSSPEAGPHDFAELRPRGVRSAA
jgi:hypothetical protein